MNTGHSRRQQIQGADGEPQVGPAAASTPTASLGRDATGAPAEVPQGAAARRPRAFGFATRPLGLRRLRVRTVGLLLVLAALTLLLGGCSGTGSRQSEGLPSVRVQVGGTEGESMSVGVQLLVMMTVLSLAPAILVMVTSFIRIAIVLSFARSAIGMQQLPPNQIMLGLAMFLTVFVRAPVWTTVNDATLQPYIRSELGMEEAILEGTGPLRTHHTRGVPR